MLVAAIAASMAPQASSQTCEGNCVVDSFTVEVGANNGGPGALRIEAGEVFTTSAGLVRIGQTDPGELSVNGLGAQFQSTGSFIFVGDGAPGSLSVTNGGRLSISAPGFTSLRIGRTSISNASSGTLLVDSGGGITVDSVDGGAILDFGEVFVNSAAVIDAQFSGTVTGSGSFLEVLAPASVNPSGGFIEARLDLGFVNVVGAASQATGVLNCSMVRV